MTLTLNNVEVKTVNVGIFSTSSMVKTTFLFDSWWMIDIIRWYYLTITNDFSKILHFLTVPQWLLCLTVLSDSLIESESPKRRLYAIQVRIHKQKQVSAIDGVPTRGWFVLRTCWLLISTQIVLWYTVVLLRCGLLSICMHVYLVYLDSMDDRHQRYPSPRFAPNFNYRSSTPRGPPQYFTSRPEGSPSRFGSPAGHRLHAPGAAGFGGHPRDHFSPHRGGFRPQYTPSPIQPRPRYYSPHTHRGRGHRHGNPVSHWSICSYNCLLLPDTKMIFSNFRCLTRSSP